MSTVAGPINESQGLFPQDGTTFESQPLQIASPEEIYLVMLEQKPMALMALTTFNHLAKHRDVIENGSRLPDLVDDDKVHEARAFLQDRGSLWRRQSDEISMAFARHLPDRELGSMHYTEGRFYTEDGKLRFELDGQINVFTSLLSQLDLNDGKKMADETLWEELLVRICLVSGK